MKFSIITVCFNAADTIEKTIESVLCQTFGDYEYILIDGGSSDGTREIIDKYASEGNVRYISEKDNGLYDAMNKGIAMAEGDFVEFLNSGDELYDEKVLEAVSETISGVFTDSDSGDLQSGDKAPKYVFYGNIIYMNPDGSTDMRLYGKSCGKPIYFATGDCVNHQAIFASRKLFTEKAFRNDLYKICADRDWMMKTVKAGAKWVPLGITTVKYDLSDESISLRDKDLLRREEKMCLKNNYPALVPIYCCFDFARNNRALSGALHGIYKKLFIR